MAKLNLLPLTLSTGFVLMCCSKASESKDKLSRKIPETVKSSEWVSQKMGGSGGSQCNCQSVQNNCVANCFFSDCCVCWNSTVETGACGCYFGIAKCSTAPIAKESRLATPGDIKFYPERFSVFLQRLDAQGVKTNLIRSAFSKMMQTANRLPGGLTIDYVLIPGTYYTLFYDRYHEFMESLPLKEQQWILNYLHEITASK